MASEQQWPKLFAEMVSHVEGSRDTFQGNEVPFYPIAQSKLTDVDVACT